jgi:hypothetical protein
MSVPDIRAVTVAVTFALELNHESEFNAGAHDTSDNVVLDDPHERVTLVPSSSSIVSFTRYVFVGPVSGPCDHITTPIRSASI